MKATAVPNKPLVPLKPLRFTFPLRKKATKDGAPGVEITDEHEFHRLLRREPGGAFAVSAHGMWHGGIHITEAGAGQFLDLTSGVLAMADGEVVAWRLDRTCPVTELPGNGQQSASQACYNTGFALVRHKMEFPRGTWLTFYSLYMHLQDLAGYENKKTLSRPAHWSPEFKVTTFARDRQRPRPGLRAAPAEQKGLRVRSARAGGTALGILPQGTQFSISERTGNWGKIARSGPPIPPRVGDFVAPDAAVGGWVFLGRENGGQVVEEFMPDTALDCIVVPPKPIRVKAGQLLGHLGRYDSLNHSAPTRMVHIEFFCGEDIKTFLQTSRAWIQEHSPHPARWKALGLPGEATLLRIDRRTKLYKAAHQEGKDAPRTDVVQMLSLAELGRRKEHKFTETSPGADNLKLNWWKVHSANMLGNEISGWVREQNFAGGRVTREYPQDWVDFQTIEGAHDPAHTLCAKSKAYVDYACDKDMPATAALDKLSPLMKSVYQTICPGSNGERAIDELCVAAKDRWQSLRASRLIIRHESEWANASKWKSLTAELEKETGANAQYAAEQRRIEKLVWWEGVKARLPDLPGPAVFHMHPVGVVGNFQGKHPLITIEMLAAANPSGSTIYHERLLVHLNTFAEKYDVTTPKRIAHFLSQIEAESKFRNVEENLLYNSQNMKEIFGCKPKTRGASAPAATISENDVVCNYGKLRPKLWSETDFYENNPENLANYVYENRYENGAGSTGDGYRYRGRGLIQTTFKANYRVLTEEHNRRFPDDPKDFVAYPDLLLTNLAYGIESAFVYWTVTRNINPIADTGGVATVSRFVNGGTHGIAARRASYNRLALLLDLPTDPAQ